MSSTVIGGIEIQMLADLARLRQDMTQAKGLVGNATADMQRMANTVKTALGAIGVGLSVGAFTAWIKSAIDAADTTSKMAQKIGVSTKEVAGLQLAFKLAGVEGNAMQTAMVTMAKRIEEGDTVFKRLGVSVRNADGSMKGSRQVLYDLADAFRGLPEGVQKTALATQVFGKAGADLIPLLNGGSEGLQAMADMAEKLGLVISEDTGRAAEEFNDTLTLVQMGGMGMATQIAAQLLPTLKGLAGSFFESMTEGDRLKRVADILSGGLKLLFSVGAIGVEVFNTLGKLLAGVAGAVVAVVQGQFGRAWDIAKEAGSDIKRGWGDTAKSIEAAWSGAGSQTVNQMTAMQRAVSGTTVVTREQEAAQRKQREEQEKLTRAGQDYLAALDAKLAATQREIDLGRTLTDSEKEILKLEEELRKGKLRLTEAELESARAKLQQIDAIREQRRQAEEYAKLLVSVAQHSSKWSDEQVRNTEAMRSQVVQLQEQNDRLRMGEAAFAAREVAVLRSMASDLEWAAANEGGNFQLEEQARLLRQRADLLEEGTALREAKAVADEWARTVQSIQDGLTDALMRGFESGKGFLDAFKDTLLNAFRTLILKPMVQSMVGDLSTGLRSVMQWAGSWFGSAQAAQQGGSGGGQGGAQGGAAAAGAGGGWLSWAGLILGGISQSRSDYAKGWNRSGLDQGWNQNINWAINPVYSSMIKPLESLGLINSKWADILGGDTAMARMFGRKPAQATGQGVTGHFGGGGFAGHQFVDWHAEGGWFRSDKRGTDYSAVDAEFGGMLSDSARRMLMQVREYGQALALPVDALASVTSSARITLGNDAEANAKAVTEALADYGAALVQGYAQQLRVFAKPGEETIDTLVRLSDAMRTVNQVFGELGLSLVQTSVAGGHVASAIIELTGGLDAFLAKSRTYLQEYFSQAEQSGITANEVLSTLGAVGIDFSGARSRQELRALMEQMDPNAGGGADKISALLNVAGDFARLADYLEANDLTLGQLAAQAPAGSNWQVTTPGYMYGPPTPSSAEQSTQLLQGANDRLQSIATGTADNTAELRALVGLQAAANQSLLARLEAVQAALEEAMRPAYLNNLGWEST